MRYWLEAGAFLHVVLLVSIIGVRLAEAQNAALPWVLPAQHLARSLGAVGRESNTNILFDATLVRGRIAPALKASATVDEALTRLLMGSGLGYRFVDEKTVTVGSAAQLS